MTKDVCSLLQNSADYRQIKSFLSQSPQKPASMCSIDEKKVFDSTSQSEVIDGNLGDPAHVDLAHRSINELTEDCDGKKVFKKRGRPFSSICDHSTDADEPQKANSNM